MISKFRIKNFRSIVDLTLDFSYGEGKAPNGYKNLNTHPFLEAPNGERLVPCMAFFGANASGKSNIIKAFRSLYILIQGTSLKEFFDIFDPNVTNPQNTGTTFEIDFFCGTNKYFYTVTYTKDAIQKEELFVDGTRIFTIEDMKDNFTAIQTDTYPQSVLSEIMRVEASDGQGCQIKPMLTCLGTRYKGLNLHVTTAFESLFMGMGVIPNTRDLSLDYVVNKLSQTTDGDTKKALAEIVEIVRKLDIDIENIEMHSWKGVPDNEQNKKYIKTVFPEIPDDAKTTLTLKTTYSFHKTVSGDIIQCSFEKMESAGTIRMASLVGLLLYTIKTGKTAIIDEFDNSLHPLIVRELLKFFKDKQYNENNAQLIFTTHTTDILEDELMRVSEITLVRKNIKYGTMVSRLIDLKKDDKERDIRNVTNFRKQYLDGFYSGIPHLAL